MAILNLAILVAVLVSPVWLVVTYVRNRRHLKRLGLRVDRPRGHVEATQHDLLAAMVNPDYERARGNMYANLFDD